MSPLRVLTRLMPGVRQQKGECDMAMTRCKECGKQMSDSADKCPNCGADSSRAVGLPPFVKWGCGLFLIAIGIGGIVVAGDNKFTELCGVGCCALGASAFFARTKKKGD